MDQTGQPCEVAYRLKKSHHFEFMKLYFNLEDIIEMKKKKGKTSLFGHKPKLAAIQSKKNTVCN